MPTPRERMTRAFAREDGIENMRPIPARANSPPAPVLLLKTEQRTPVPSRAPDLLKDPARQYTKSSQRQDRPTRTAPPPLDGLQLAHGERSPNTFLSPVETPSRKTVVQRSPEMSPEQEGTRLCGGLSPDIQEMLIESKAQLRKALRASMLSESRLLLSTSPEAGAAARENARDCPLFDFSPSPSTEGPVSPILLSHATSVVPKLTPPGARPRRSKAGIGTGDTAEFAAAALAADVVSVAKSPVHVRTEDIAVDNQSLPCGLQDCRHVLSPIQHAATGGEVALVEADVQTSHVLQARVAASFIAQKEAAKTGAVVRIQSLARGRKDRRQVQALRAHKAAALAEAEDQEKERAKAEADVTTCHAKMCSPHRLEEETDQILKELRDLLSNSQPGSSATEFLQSQKRAMQQMALPANQGTGLDCASWISQPSRGDKFPQDAAATQIRESSWLSDLAQAAAVSIISPFVVGNTAAPNAVESCSLEAANRDCTQSSCQMYPIDSMEEWMAIGTQPAEVPLDSMASGSERDLTARVLCCHALVKDVRTSHWSLERVSSIECSQPNSATPTAQDFAFEGQSWHVHEQEENLVRIMT